MDLTIREIHAAPEAGLINQEWIVVENQSDSPVHTKGLRLTVQPAKGRPREIGVIDPGFVLAPGARQRIVSGSPGRKSLGTPPDDSTPNYCLFLKAGYVDGPACVLRISRNQVEIAQAVYDPDSASGVRP